MHHPSARFAIATILAGNGFSERALALTLSAALGDIATIPADLRDKALQRSASMKSDAAAAYSGLLNQASIPADKNALCAQVCPVLVQHPAQIGMQVASLHALTALWPHTAANERGLLRQRFLGAITNRSAPEASMVCVEQLRAWQRDVPTTLGDCVANVANLKSFLSEEEPWQAYNVLSEHLGADMDVTTLSQVVGALTVHVLLQYRDPNGQTAQALLGAVALEQLSHCAPPEFLATLVSQQGHFLWWRRNRAGLSRIRACLDSTPMSLPEAVRSGDITAAQRSARTFSKHPQLFWEAARDLLGEWMGRDDEQWLRSLSAFSAIAYRSAGAAVSPDDAAGLASAFADMACQDRPEVVGNRG
jgi:hypothetical protein